MNSTDIHQGLRIIFAGTPEFAAGHLQALLETRHKVVAVYTQPDRPAGRGKKLSASPVKELAVAHNISVFQPASLKSSESQAELAALDADLMVVVAYGLILPKAVLDAPRLGCINVHASILPRWRGAAPIQRAIEAGDMQSGVTIMQMDVGLDTGDMLIKAFCPILVADIGGSLHDRLLDIGAPALIEALDQIQNGNITPEKQDDSKVITPRNSVKKKPRLIGSCLPPNWSEKSARLTRFPWRIRNLKAQQMMRGFEFGLQKHQSKWLKRHLELLAKLIAMEFGWFVTQVN